MGATESRRRDAEDYVWVHVEVRPDAPHVRVRLLVCDVGVHAKCKAMQRAKELHNITRTHAPLPPPQDPRVVRDVYVALHASGSRRCKVQLHTTKTYEELVEERAAPILPEREEEEEQTYVPPFDLFP